MTDKMTPEQRHYCMSRIRSNDTKPEMTVRRFLWGHGYRYRLHKKSMPGTPDIVIRRLRVAIFINGCFWHGHTCRVSIPRTNAKFWHDKIERNKMRDLENGIKLRNAGWFVITIWECELKKSEREATLNRLLATLRALDPAHSSPPAKQHPYSYPTPEYYPAAAEPPASYE